MTSAEATSPSGLVARVRGILVSPSSEWRAINPEVTSVARLFTGYACVLLAIPALATALQVFLFRHVGLTVALIVAVLSYAVSLVSLLVLGVIFNVLAPAFGGRRDFTQAMKLAIYPQTAGAVAGIVDVFPLTGIVVTAAGIYGLYILWVGLPK